MARKKAFSFLTHRVCRATPPQGRHGLRFYRLDIDITGNQMLAIFFADLADFQRNVTSVPHVH